MQCPPLDLTDTFFDNEGHPIRGAVGCLAEVLSKQLQATLKLLVATLDGQGLQTLFMTSQTALRDDKMSLFQTSTVNARPHLHKHGGSLPWRILYLEHIVRPKTSPAFHRPF